MMSRDEDIVKKLLSKYSETDIKNMLTFVRAGGQVKKASARYSLYKDVCAALNLTEGETSNADDAKYHADLSSEIWHEFRKKLTKDQQQKVLKNFDLSTLSDVTELSTEELDRLLMFMLSLNETTKEGFVTLAESPKKDYKAGLTFKQYMTQLTPAKLDEAEEASDGDKSPHDKNIRKKIRDAMSEISDGVSFKKDGTIAIKRGYFYRPKGLDPEQYGAGIKSRLEKEGLTVEVVSTRDHWAPWPRDSYYVVIIRVK